MTLFFVEVGDRGREMGLTICSERRCLVHWVG